NDLQEQMDPGKQDSLIHKLCEDVNGIIAEVFPACGIEIVPSLQGVGDVLRPKYEVGLFSNVSTDVDRQGTGLVRTAAFAMLRYHSRLKSSKDLATPPLLA